MIWMPCKSVLPYEKHKHFERVWKWLKPTFNFNTASTHSLAKCSFFPWRIFELSVVRAMFIRSLRNCSIFELINKKESIRYQIFFLHRTCCFSRCLPTLEVLRSLPYAIPRWLFEDEFFGRVNFPFPKKHPNLPKYHSIPNHTRRSSLAKTTTDVVPSPTSSSCTFEISSENTFE